MKKSKILITGGAGYIGSHVNCLLAEKGYETIVLDNLIYGHESLVQWGQFIKGDIRDTNLLDTIFEEFAIEAVLHFAAFAYVGESVVKPSLYYNNNVHGSICLLDALKKHNVTKVVFSSTCATYGEPQEYPITESHPQNPINPYGRSKLMIEQAIADYAHAYGLNSVVLRYFNAAGADEQGRIGEKHDPETHLIPLVLEAAKNPQKSINIFGTDYDTADGTCIRDYIHVTDLAHAHLLALEHLLNAGDSRTFNLGNGTGFSVREVIECAKSVTNKPINVTEDERRAGDPAKLVGSSGKIVSALGWNPQFTDIEKIIQTAWNWQLKL